MADDPAGLSARSRPWLILLATLVCATGTASLGRWQLSRAAHKEALQQLLDSRRQLPALPASDLALDEAGARAQHHRRIRLQGRWLAARTVFLDNRQMDGRPGFFVVTPLLLSAHDAVLIQRGWAPRDAHDRTHTPEVATPDRELVQVGGHIAPPPAQLYALGGGDTGVIRQNLDPVAYGQEIGVVMRPLSIVQDDPPNTDDGLLRHWPAPALDVSRHYGYAAQWFAMSALSVGLYLWFQVIKPRWRADGLS